MPAHPHASALPAVSVREHARRVIAITTQAWKILPASPRALARQAPWGHMPLRARGRGQSRALTACQYLPSD